MNEKQISSEIRSQVKSLSDDAVSILQELVRIPSITGEELCVQQEIRRLLCSRKLEIDEWNPTREDLQAHPAFSDDQLPLGNRPVLVAKWKGSGGGRSLILNGHVDVVPPGDWKAWTHSPWSAWIQDGKLYGRGACDMKGGIVSAIVAIDILQRIGFQPRGDVLLECVIGEETGGVGTLATILKGYTADAALVLEPTCLELCPVGAGAASFRLNVPGKAAHGAMRLEGISAIEKFYPLLTALMQFEQQRNLSFAHSLFRKDMPAAPISIGKIFAGDWPSTVAENLIAEGRYGVLPGEDILEAREKFEKKIREASAADPWLSEHPPAVEWFEGQFESAETPLDSDFLHIVSESHHEILSAAPKTHGVPYGSDLRFFTNYARIPALLYGPGNVAQAHTVDEFISLVEVLNAACVVARLITAWCC